MISSRKAMARFGTIIYFILIAIGFFSLFFINSKYQQHKNDLAIIASKRISNDYQANPLKSAVPKDVRVKSFKIIVTENSYSPSIIKVNKGDIVKIHLYSEKGYNNFTIPPLGIRSKLLATNKSDEFRFVATMSGNFEFTSDSFLYYDSSPVGTLIVEQ